LDILRCLVRELGADVDLEYDGGGTPLLYAAQEGHLDILLCLLEEFGADVNNEDESMGRSALFWSAENGNLDMVRCLLEHGANIDQANNLGVTPLMAASFNKHAEVVTWLIKAGADTQIAIKNEGSSAVTAAYMSREYGASAEQTAYLEAKTHCSNTGCSGAGIMKCTSCKQARYCGEPCQLAHWKAHKAECKRWSAELKAGKRK
jgi:hypothetical protein